MGSLRIELESEKAPETVANFLRYVDAAHYDGTIFHRVIANFMVQGGGYDQGLNKKAVRDPVQNEATNGLKNVMGTVAMARTSDPHSATAQFFVNVSNNESLNHTAPSGSGWGYCVFGRITEGMDVIDAMRAVPTGPSGPFAKDAPETPIVIKSIRRA